MQHRFGTPLLADADVRSMELERRKELLARLERASQIAARISRQEHIRQAASTCTSAGSEVPDTVAQNRHKAAKLADVDGNALTGTGTGATSSAAPKMQAVRTVRGPPLVTPSISTRPKR